MTAGPAMTPVDDADSVPVRDAATVVLARDTVDGVEVFMLRRNTKATFVGGMYVFPGGAVDRADVSPTLEQLAGGLTDAAASDRMGLERGGLAYWVAAVRECFEECGVLLAHHAGGDQVRFEDDEIVERFETHRHQVHDGELTMVDLCAAESLTLDLSDIRYFAHWITPVGPPRRFDTRFFAARAPLAQVATEDAKETVAHLWVRPADALARHEAGELDMILPTIATLEDLAAFDTVADLFADLDGRGRPPALLPKIRPNQDGPPSVLLPGDDGYDEA